MKIPWDEATGSGGNRAGPRTRRRGPGLPAAAHGAGPRALGPGRLEPGRREGGREGGRKGLRDGRTEGGREGGKEGKQMLEKAGRGKEGR